MLKKVFRVLSKFLPIQAILEVSKRIILPGFDGLPLYNVADFFIKGLSRGALTTRASSLAFRFMLAIFPGVIFLFTLIPYIPIDNFQGELLKQLETVMPEAAYSLTASTLEDLISRERTGLLSFGFILTLYFATNGVNAMMLAFNQSVHVSERRSIFKQRFIALILILILSILLISSVVLIVFSQTIISTLVSYDWISSGWNLFLLNFGKWLVILTLFYFSISFIYFMGSPGHSKWRFFSAGSSLATLLTIAASLVFAFYIDHFGQLNKLYGSLGSFIIIMLWMYFNCLILLIGFELNASIISASKNQG